MYKKYLVTLIIFNFIGIICLFAQEATKQNSSTYRKNVGFHKSKPVRDFPDAKPVKKGEKKEAKDKLPYEKGKLTPHKAKRTAEADPIIQGIMGTQALDTPKVNFDGCPGQLYPPDPTGAVGPNHFVQANNILFAVYD